MFLYTLLGLAISKLPCGLIESREEQNTNYLYGKTIAEFVLSLVRLTDLAVAGKPYYLNKRLVWFNLKHIKPNTYTIVGMSEDNDVKDVDVYVYYEDGDLYIKDDDTSNVAVVVFTLKYNQRFKVIVKNYKSNTPNYSSTVRSIVAYK